MVSSTKIFVFRPLVLSPEALAGEVRAVTSEANVVDSSPKNTSDFSLCLFSLHNASNHSSYSWALGLTPSHAYPTDPPGVQGEEVSFWYSWEAMKSHKH